MLLRILCGGVFTSMMIALPKLLACVGLLNFLLLTGWGAWHAQVQLFDSIECERLRPSCRPHCSCRPLRTCSKLRHPVRICRMHPWNADVDACNQRTHARAPCCCCVIPFAQSVLTYLDHCLPMNALTQIRRRRLPAHRKTHQPKTRAVPCEPGGGRRYA